MIGATIDKYVVLQRIGEGATATVYRGRHTTIGREVAIKVLHPHLSASSRNKERFNREARAVGRLSHPNIVSILDYSGPNVDDCYIVCELVKGVTLLGLLQESGRIPSEIAAVIGADIASALAFAHTQGVVHRDVKPENVMISREGQLKLMDFGVARVLDESTITMDGSLLGSPAYMSPQQALDQPLDGRSDIFSLGSLLFHCVTGHVPFAGGNPSVILRNIIDGNRAEALELAPEAAPAMVSVIDRLLQSRPDDRPANADEARTALLGCLAAVGLTPDDPLVNLRSYLLDPAAARAALESHLRPTLLASGKAKLAAGDTLAALHDLNRLLAFDEENEEVLALIQSLHQGPVGAVAPGAGRRRAAVWVAVGVAALALAGVGLSALRPDPPPEAPLEGPRPPVTSVAPPDAAPATTPPAPAPDAAPAPTRVSAPRPVDRTPIPPTASPLALARGGPPPADDPGVRPAKGRIVLQLGTPVDVWVDGRLAGSFRKGPTEDWVGTPGAPIEVEPGERRIALRNNPSVEDWEGIVLVRAGESTLLRPPLARKPVVFQVDPSLPRDCTVAHGARDHGRVADFGATFQITDPAPDEVVTFRCPEPLGTFSEAIGQTFGGDLVVVPRRLPQR